MKLLSVSLIDGTKLEVLLEDNANASAVFNAINSGELFNAKTLDGEEAEVFVHGAKFSGFVLSSYTASPDLIAYEEVEDEQVFPIFFEDANGDIYGSDGSTLKSPCSNKGSHPFCEDDVITIV